MRIRGLLIKFFKEESAKIIRETIWGVMQVNVPNLSPHFGVNRSILEQKVDVNKPLLARYFLKNDDRIP